MPDKVGGLFGRLSLTDKLTAIGAATAALALLATAAAMLVYDYTSQRGVLVRDTAMLAEVVGANSTAALAFADAKVASETLSAVAANPHIVSAAVHQPALLDRLGGDEGLLTEVSRVFLEDCPGRLAAIRSAIEARDADRVRTSAHALKGAAANLSARGLFEAASTLERLGAESRLDAAEAASRLVAAEASNVMDALRREMSIA